MTGEKTSVSECGSAYASGKGDVTFDPTYVFMCTNKAC